MRSNLVIVVAVIPREPISDSVRPFQLFSIAILILNDLKFIKINMIRFIYWIE